MNTIGDFIHNLKGKESADMQSDEAVELLNECLPKNMLIARIPVRCCATCRHYHSQERVCFEGGYSEIGDPYRELTDDDCNAWESK